MGDHLFERGTIKQRCGQNVHRVKPTTRLANVFDDEVRGVVRIKPVRVLEGVVNLSEGHRPRVKPDVQHIGDASHHGLSAGVIRVRAHQLINGWPVQIRGLYAEVPLEFLE